MERVQYFKDVLNSEIIRLTSLVEKWEDISIENEIPDEVYGKILSVIGQCKLLLNDKLQQFKNLINICNDNNQTVKITTDDLEGFWDLVNIQIEDVTKKFDLLQVLQSNKWVVTEGVYRSEPEVLIPKQKKRIVDKNLKLTNSAKLRLEAAKLEMKSKIKSTNNDDMIFL